jgi:hypothetical protein
MKIALTPVGTVAMESGEITIADTCHVTAKAGLPSGIVCTLEMHGGDSLRPVFTFEQDGHEYIAIQRTAYPKC